MFHWEYPPNLTPTLAFHVSLKVNLARAIWILAFHVKDIFTLGCVLANISVQLSLFSVSLRYVLKAFKFAATGWVHQQFPVLALPGHSHTWATEGSWCRYGLRQLLSGSPCTPKCSRASVVGLVPMRLSTACAGAFTNDSQLRFSKRKVCLFCSLLVGLKAHDCRGCYISIAFCKFKANKGNED